MNKIKDLKLPLSRAAAKSLKLGETVTVSGKLFTGRSRFHIRAVEKNIFPPLDYDKINCFFHVGPVLRRQNDQWEIVSCEPTSSIRFERYGADIVEKFNIRCLIGKTVMGPRTAAALKKTGAVYLSKIGLCGNQLREQVTKIIEVYFLDELGKTEATWVFEVKKFGPFFVAMDADGNNYFSDLGEECEAKMPQINEMLEVGADYAYTSVNHVH